MSTDTVDIGQWIRRLTTKAVEEQTRALRRYGELIQRVTEGDIDSDAVREEAVRFVREESARYARSLASLTLSYQDALLDLDRARNDEFFNALVAAGQDVAPAPNAARTVPLELTGPVGSEVSASFLIENRKDQPTDVSFAVSDFVDRDQRVSFRPPLQITPSRLRLEPRESQRVRVSLPLLPQVFEPQVHYEATIVVRGYEEIELRLIVETTVPQANDDAGIDISVESDAQGGQEKSVSAASPPGAEAEPVSQRNDDDSAADDGES